MGFVFVAALFCLFNFADCTCPAGWRFYGTACYHFSHAKEDWRNAKALCEILGGHLAEINDAGEGGFLSTKVSSINGPAFWVSLNYLEKEGEYMWAYSNTNLASSSFADWSRSKHTNFVEEENCVAIGYNGQWFDDVCAENRHYICEKDAPGAAFDG